MWHILGRRFTYRVLVEKPEGKISLESSMRRRIILKCILKK
jgi:hypothetical protein